MAEGDYQPEPYRSTFPLDFNSQHYEYQKQKYQPPSQVYQSSYGKAGAPSGVDSIDTVLNGIENLGDVGSKTTCQVKKQMGEYVLDLKHYIKMF